jgi:hypothetical protein
MVSGHVNRTQRPNTWLTALSEPHQLVVAIWRHGPAGLPRYMSRRCEKLAIAAHNGVLVYAATLASAKGRLIHSHHAVDENEKQTRKHDQRNTFKDCGAVE